MHTFVGFTQKVHSDMLPVVTATKLQQVCQNQVCCNGSFED